MLKRFSFFNDLFNQNNPLIFFSSINSCFRSWNNSRVIYDCYVYLKNYRLLKISLKITTSTIMKSSMSTKAFDDHALREFGTLGRVIEIFWIRNVSRGTTMKRGPERKVRSCATKNFDWFSLLSVFSDKFKKCGKFQEKKGKNHF